VGVVSVPLDVIDIGLGQVFEVFDNEQSKPALG
jgi:hypothetical protein